METYTEHYDVDADPGDAGPRPLPPSPRGTKEADKSHSLTSPLALEALSVELARKKHTRHIKKRKKSDRAFGYARYSDDGQDPMSIDRQVADIIETNRKWGLPEPTMFIDVARTGQNNSRQGARDLFAALDANYGASLTIESGDRLFRSLSSYAGFQESISRNCIRIFTRNGPMPPEMLPLEAIISVMEVQRLQTRFRVR